MRLVLKTGKIRLLNWAKAGYIALNDSGVAVLRLPGKRLRYVTEEMDELEYFKLVHVVDGEFHLTEYGDEKLQEYINQGGDNDKKVGNDRRAVPDTPGRTASP